MRTIYKVKHGYASRWKFGEKFLNPLTKLVFVAKASICSTIKDLNLNFRTFSPFVNIILKKHRLR